MTAITKAEEAAGEATDRAALLLMLAYVEAECRRLGAVEAARHAAQAAALLPATAAPAATPVPPRLRRLH